MTPSPRGGLAYPAAAAYCRCVIAAVGLGGTLLVIIAGLTWTARLVHVGNLDALELAEKVAAGEPVSALDWPELHVRSVVPQPGEPSLALLFVEWPARPERAATLLVRLDDPGKRSVLLLSRWCTDRASVSPTRRDERVEFRRRRSLERVRGLLVAEDAVRPPQRHGPSARPDSNGRGRGGPPARWGL
jgi:hypothetical protein